MADMWDLHSQGNWVVVPTNCMITKGSAVMGGGIALDAAEKFPNLPKEYAESLLISQIEFYYDNDIRVILLPTKVDWRNPSSLSLIELGVLHLTRLVKTKPSWFASCKIVVPAIGCGLGGLDWETQVKPVLKPLYDDPEHFIVLDPI